ncbi:hypothetical protein [Zavarzinella formosa]|uniref:hypothetical protein n=1 Tax=Zavarzinella formosa TaxID=360055 RepID=UPI0002E8AC81|nr:hypothetical protein [Zavarzinella formosa]
MRHAVAALIASSLTLFADFAVLAAEKTTPEAMFEQRIMPIFKSPNPSSCVQCHLAGVDIKNYILPSAEKTFRSMRDQGLIDLKSPADSKILKLIEMGQKDPKAPAIHANNRKAELEAFTAWIKACAADKTLSESPKLAEAEQAKPPVPDAVIRHARKDRLLESFERNIWAMRFRCMNCHTEGTPANDKYRKQFGDRVAWVRKGGSGETMNFLLESKLIDVKTPENSLLIQKPLNAVKHEGGLKFAVGDQAHKSFRQWVEDVAAIKSNAYQKVADLPPVVKSPRAFGTELWLKVGNTPPAWGDKLLQVDVHARTADGKGWEKTPIASTDRIVFGKGSMWQHTLTLFAEPGSDLAKKWANGKPFLPRGTYLLKAYVDANGRLKKDWKSPLTDKDFVGQVEITADWREGYGAMTAADGRQFRK